MFIFFAVAGCGDPTANIFGQTCGSTTGAGTTGHDTSTTLRRAIAFRKMREFDSAVAYTQQILAAHPSDPCAINELGMIAADRHEFDTAVLYYSQAIEIAPDFPLFYANRRYSLSQAGRLEEAERDAAKWEELSGVSK